MQLQLNAIGIVHNKIESRGRLNAKDAASEIEIFPQYIDGLDGLDPFSHVIVLFWFHKIRKQERTFLKVHPRGDTTLPLTGVFATRSPARPNPIGITVVKLLRRNDRILTVSGLDAINNTPVLDIKPYIPEDSASCEIIVPAWIKQLHK